MRSVASPPSHVFLLPRSRPLACKSRSVGYDVNVEETRWVSGWLLLGRRLSLMRKWCQRLHCVGLENSNGAAEPIVHDERSRSSAVLSLVGWLDESRVTFEILSGRIMNNFVAIFIVGKQFLWLWKWSSFPRSTKMVIVNKTPTFF